MKKRISTLKEIHKGNLVLRKLNPETDSEQLLRLLSDEEVIRFIKRQKVSEVSDAQRFIEKMNGGMDHDEWGFWAISLLDKPELMGTICLWSFSLDRKEAEIGFELLPEYQGNGYMSQAVGMVQTIAFSFLKLTKIKALADVRNEKSQRLLDKNGFEKVQKLEDDGQFYFLYAANNSQKKKKKEKSSTISDMSPNVGASIDPTPPSEPS